EGEAKADISKIVARSRGVAETMSKGIDFLMKKNKIDVLRGHGSIESKGVVTVENEEGRTLYEADHIILATGARPRQMPFIPVDGEKIITSREALVIKELPESIVVIGSGAIGSEFAFLFAQLGVKVTIVEYLPNLMPLEDEEVSKTMERAFRKMRATVYTGTTVKAARVNDEGRCEVDIEGKKGAETLVADMVLAAVGIKTNTENIGLEKVGIELERDKIKVDEHYQTAVEGIYAIGDLIPTPALAHVASAEAINCVDTICGRSPQPIDYSTIPSCVYTSPEVASVGLTEKQAAEKGIELKVGRFQFTASGKAAAAGERDGFVKLLFDAATDKLLGAHFVGMNVTEMIAEPTVAKALGATAEVLAHTIHPHPTMNEAVMEAAEAALGHAIHG
ncbi:MAG: dihydrolipoyl dehydrogenase, partial [Rikenellaceae bacterium]|nr:dihydrolipoyl dehydrogenase [Rikenellaceae bacterium]